MHDLGGFDHDSPHFYDYAQAIGNLTKASAALSTMSVSKIQKRLMDFVEDTVEKGLEEVNTELRKKLFKLHSKMQSPDNLEEKEELSKTVAEEAGQQEGSGTKGRSAGVSRRRGTNIEGQWRRLPWGSRRRRSAA